MTSIGLLIFQKIQTPSSVNYSLCEYMPLGEEGGGFFPPTEIEHCHSAKIMFYFLQLHWMSRKFMFYFLKFHWKWALPSGQNYNLFHSCDSVIKGTVWQIAIDLHSFVSQFFYCPMLQGLRLHPSPLFYFIFSHFHILYCAPKENITKRLFIKKYKSFRITLKSIPP